MTADELLLRWLARQHGVPPDTIRNVRVHVHPMLGCLAVTAARHDSAHDLLCVLIPPHQLIDTLVNEALGNQPDPDGWEPLYHVNVDVRPSVDEGVEWRVTWLRPHEPMEGTRTGWAPDPAEALLRVSDTMQKGSGSQ